MNPSRNSHCKTSQIMRNTFMVPNQHGEERCGLLFWAVGLLETCHPAKHWTERGNRGKLSLPRGQSKQPGHTDGLASLKRFHELKGLRALVLTAAAVGGFARQNIKSSLLQSSLWDVAQVSTENRVRACSWEDPAGCLASLWVCTGPLHPHALGYCFRNWSLSRNTPGNFSFFLNVLPAICNILQQSFCIANNCCCH